MTLSPSRKREKVEKSNDDDDDGGGRRIVIVSVCSPRIHQSELLLRFFPPQQVCVSIRKAEAEKPSSLLGSFPRLTILTENTHPAQASFILSFLSCRYGLLLFCFAFFLLVPGNVRKKESLAQ